MEQDKYTADHIYEAFLAWETDLRLNPENYVPSRDVRDKNVEDVADNNTNVLLKFIHTR
tara:strand:+ start:737 stop:913 length:177 start_codon:yes stop_codon:yes gene_type:complete